MDGPPITRGRDNTKTTTIQMHRMHGQFGIMYVKLYIQVADRVINTGQDHTEFETGENVYMGLDGFYLLRDDEEQALNLPRDAHDIPLSICAKRYGPDGALVYNTNGNTGVWGDVIHVYEANIRGKCDANKTAAMASRGRTSK